MDELIVKLKLILLNEPIFKNENIFKLHSNICSEVQNRATDR